MGNLFQHVHEKWTIILDLQHTV
jgi:hypothetical protein